MIRPPRFIDVKPNEIDKNTEYQGYRKGNSHFSLCTITFDENFNPIIFHQHSIDEEERKEITCYFRYMTWQEEEEWYKNVVDFSNKANVINLIGLHTDLYDIGDSCHEMWNGWVGTTWREQLMNLLDENFFIIGIAPLPNSCIEMVFRNPVAVVCEEYDTGQRFWCHAEKDWIDDMREESKTYYEALMKEI